MPIPPRCDNCFFSIWVINPNRPILICKQRENKVGRWWGVQLEQSCPNFYPSGTFKAGSEATRRIPLTRGKFALVDVEDYYRLVKFNWYASFNKNTFYASRAHNKKIVKMHRLIMNAPEHLLVDHIDHNGLNNVKSNLRLCSHLQNARNRVSAARSTSKYKGVYCCKIAKKWAAGIHFNNKRHHIGMFENEIDAAKAYDKKAAEIFGEFACLNFPPKATENQPQRTQRPPRNMSFPRKRETRIKSDTIRRGFFNHEEHERLVIEPASPD